MLGGVLTLVLSSALVCVTAVVVVRRLRLRGLLERLVAFGVTGVATVVAVSLVVGGLLRMYRPLPLLCACALIAAVAVAAELRWPTPRRTTSRWASGWRARPWFTAAAGVLALAVCGQYLWRLLLAVRLPAMDWDGLQYHLVAADTWIQAGYVGHSPYTVWADVYPLNIELLFGWTGVFGHTMRYAPLVQFPLYLLGGIAVAGLARRMDAGRRAAVVAGLVYLAMPAVFAQASTSYIDAASAALALSALYLLTGLVPARRAGVPLRRGILVYIGLGGVATGLAVGAKTPYLVLLPVGVAALLVSLWRLTPPAERRWTAWCPAVLALVTAAVPVAAFGSFWYQRTWIAYGNPFHPFTLGPFAGEGTVQDLIMVHNTPPEMAGGGLSAIAASWSSDFERHVVQYDSRFGGLGMAWLTIIVPLALAAIWLYIRSGRRGPLPVYLAAGVLTFVMSPAPWWARYTLLTAAVGCALAAVALTRLAVERRAAAVICLAALTGLSGLSMWWGTNPTFICPVDTCDTEGPLTARATFDLMWRPGRADRIWPWKHYTALDQIPNGSTIAVPAEPEQRFFHPIFGADLQRRVVVIDPPSTVDALAEAMRATGARYVLLDPRMAHDVAVAAGRDPRFAVRTTDTRIYGADLFEFGSFPDQCRHLAADIRLTGTVRVETGTKLTFTVTDGCQQPMPGARVELYGSDHDRHLPYDDVRTARRTTGEDGRVTFTVGEKPGRWDYFARYTGGNYDQPAVTPRVMVTSGTSANR
ncbi:hypothetical protein Afil01_32480 [Actinorhabdospora filicis]|uniref:4-amino-4-deoxy-L-arabinose transferase-like glycosyltransferase n=1 Tax=Actinorhabdospora filicis TaxID=1785913 RepID=A0A9W6WAB7_9ACTN|nr:hypothetical protein [Actinorhabdospora filicis]GLZ78441.1 hypothetical protein Afil01_32480 [Actinorhabdospora filicis]